jgi:hypothetical protein
MTRHRFAADFVSALIPLALLVLLAMWAGSRGLDLAFLAFGLLIAAAISGVSCIAVAGVAQSESRFLRPACVLVSLLLFAIFVFFRT